MIKRCTTCNGIVREQAIEATMAFEQVKFYVRELKNLGVPDHAVEPLKDWARTLGRCSCNELVFEI